MIIIAISLAIGTPMALANYSNGWNRIVLLGNNAIKFLDPLDFNNQSLTNIGSVCLANVCINSWTDLNGTTFNVTPTITLPASNISAGIFGANVGGGNYTFPNLLTTKYINVTGTDLNATFNGDVKITGKLYGGSPVKIAGGLDVLTGTSTFNDIVVTSCIGCSQFNGTTNFSAVNVTNGTFINLNVLGNLSLPNNSIINEYISSLDAAKLFNVGALDYRIQISQNNITTGIVLPFQNITNVTFPNITQANISGGITIPMNNVTGRDYSILVSQANISTGITIPSSNVTGGLDQNGVTIPQSNISTGITIPASNVTGLNISNRTYNESGIARNYSITGASLTGNLPSWQRIHISGSVQTTTTSSILLNFNSDSTAKYLYRRIQGLTFLYQAVTVNPQQNITLEQIASVAARDIDITIYRTGSSISGDFSVTTYVNSTYGPYKTMGSFNYANTTDLTSFSLSPSFTSGSYLIVRSETL